jgi:xanthine dehydrogenase accessory factor
MNQAALKARAQAWLDEGRKALIVQVRAARGSVPRDAGARMLVGTEHILGTIGGGHLEWLAVQTAQRCLAMAAPCPEPQRLALGPALGQCCGGAVELHYEVLDAAALDRWEVPRGRFHVCLYGAGHVGQALTRVLADIDCTVDWIDVRDEAFAGLPNENWTRSPTLRCIVSDGPVAEALAAPGGAHHVVMTHSHALDYDIVQALMTRTDTGLVGLIGSMTKRRRFEHRLVARGVPAARVAELACPIGVEGVTGKEPMAVAIAVAAQLLSQPFSHRVGARQEGDCGLMPTDHPQSTPIGVVNSPLSGTGFIESTQ